jgi:hypothetical protein
MGARNKKGIELTRRMCLGRERGLVEQLDKPKYLALLALLKLAPLQ